MGEVDILVLNMGQVDILMLDMGQINLNHWSGRPTVAWSGKHAVQLSRLQFCCGSLSLHFDAVLDLIIGTKFGGSNRYVCQMCLFFRMLSQNRCICPQTWHRNVTFMKHRNPFILRSKGQRSLPVSPAMDWYQNLLPVWYPCYNLNNIFNLYLTVTFLTLKPNHIDEQACNVLYLLSIMDL